MRTSQLDKVKIALADRSLARRALGKLRRWRASPPDPARAAANLAAHATVSRRQDRVWFPGGHSAPARPTDNQEDVSVWLCPASIPPFAGDCVWCRGGEHDAIEFVPRSLLTAVLEDNARLRAALAPVMAENSQED